MPSDPGTASSRPPATNAHGDEERASDSVCASSIPRCASQRVTVPPSAVATRLPSGLTAHATMSERWVRVTVCARIPTARRMTPSRVTVVSQRPSPEKAKLRTPSTYHGGRVPVGKAVSPSSPRVVQNVPSPSTAIWRTARPATSASGARVWVVRSQASAPLSWPSARLDPSGLSAAERISRPASTTQSSRNSLAGAGRAHGRKTRSRGKPTSRSSRRHSGAERSAVSTWGSRRARASTNVVVSPIGPCGCIIASSSASHSVRVRATPSSAAVVQPASP